MTTLPIAVTSLRAFDPFTAFFVAVTIAGFGILILSIVFMAWRHIAEVLRQRRRVTHGGACPYCRHKPCGCGATGEPA